MKSICCAFVLSVLASSAEGAVSRQPEDRPNFVVLFMDDLGYGDLGFTGHPTTRTPNIDKLARHGKVLTTWYSGCSVCSGSRGALMTGRQFPRIGLPGVFGPTVNVGLPANETTVAEQLKAAGYATAIVGKWHLGQRKAYLPANNGFDYYLGIPYSDDMGNGARSDCTSPETKERQFEDKAYRSPTHTWPMEDYKRAGFLQHVVEGGDPDPAHLHLPLVYQEFNDTRVLEQPLDFTNLAGKYNAFATKFIQTHQDEPFFLYVPFSHVHTTSETQPDHQYAGCAWKNTTRRGAFGDALAEADSMIGNIVQTLQEAGVENNTLILFSSDNGPNLQFGTSAGSAGLLTGRFAEYSNTAKGSTWEGGIREPAFAYWKGRIEPYSRSSEVVSSLDIFPTLSSLAGVPLPNDRVIDGRDMTDVLLHDKKSQHDFLFFYGTCFRNKNWDGPYAITAVRHGKYKAHWCTGPGLGGNLDQNKVYDPYPLLFDVDRDPSESMPISTGQMPQEPEHFDAMERIMKAYAFEKATFTHGSLSPEPDEPGEGPAQYGVCCDREKDCNCLGGELDLPIGLLNIGSRAHHDFYHEILNEEEPSPPTRAQMLLRGE
jgi:arylsulfatase A